MSSNKNTCFIQTKICCLKNFVNSSGVLVENVWLNQKRVQMMETGGHGATGRNVIYNYLVILDFHIASENVITQSNFFLLIALLLALVFFFWVFYFRAKEYFWLDKSNQKRITFRPHNGGRDCEGPTSEGILCSQLLNCTIPRKTLPKSKKNNKKKTIRQRQRKKNRHKHK